MSTFLFTFLFFFCPQDLFHWCSLYPGAPNPEVHVCRCVFDLPQGQMLMSVDEWGDDGGSGYHGLAEGPVLGKLMIRKKGDFGVRK